MVSGSELNGCLFDFIIVIGAVKWIRMFVCTAFTFGYINVLGELAMQKQLHTDLQCRDEIHKVSA